MVLEYARSETRYGGYRQKGIRCRGIEDFRESSLRHSGAQPFQSFTLAGESDKRIGKQTFRQYRSAARSSPLFLPMEPAQLFSHVISPRRSWNDPAVSTILLITSGFFNWIWSTAIPLSHPSDRKPTICTDLCRLPSPPPPFIYWLHLWKILKRVSRKRIDPVSLGCLSLGLMFLRYIRFNVIWFFLVIRFKVFIYLYFFFLKTLSKRG